jgi:membrane protein DedA with SNARE-associated domain
MNDALLALVPDWGLWLVFAATLLSCLALPVPSSLIMLGAGGFAASGDLPLWGVMATAYLGAVLGDQAGYSIGHAGGVPLLTRIGRDPRRQALIDRARAAMDRHGGTGVFLSRWLFSPLGPYVNLIAGATTFNRRRFTVAGAAGEAVWVTIYVGLGWAFADNIVAIGALLGDLFGVLAGAAVTLMLALWLHNAARDRREAASREDGASPAPGR